MKEIPHVVALVRFVETHADPKHVCPRYYSAEFVRSIEAARDTALRENALLRRRLDLDLKRFRELTEELEIARNTIRSLTKELADERAKPPLYVIAADPGDTLIGVRAGVALTIAPPWYSHIAAEYNVTPQDVGVVLRKSADGLFVVDVEGRTYVASLERLRPA